jgi:Meiotically up-regulated gene 113
VSVNPYPQLPEKASAQSDQKASRPAAFLSPVSQCLVSKRPEELSKMAAIPMPFKVYYSCQVNAVEQAERRLHLVLDEKRINRSKEFFKISPSIARSLCEQVPAFGSEDCRINSAIYLRRDYCPLYSPTLTAWGQNVLLVMMAATVNNNIFEQMSNHRRTSVDGFLSSQQIGEVLRSTKSVSETLSGFCKTGSQLHFHYGIGEPAGPVFGFGRYRRRCVVWKFSDAYRDSFLRM